MLENLLAANQRALEAEFQWAPFSGTPMPERQLLEEVSELATADRAAAGTKLAALAKAIRIRQDTVERLDRERGLSLRLARWGWLGTVGFSVLAIVLGVMALG
jgi:predicted DsbA family dithiol-disulfide isomerase